MCKRDVVSARENERIGERFRPSLPVRRLQCDASVVRRAVPGQPFSLDDGLGIRRVESDGRMQTEILELAPALAAQAMVEHAIRGRASRYADLDIRSFAPVRRIERIRGSLHILSEMPAGVRLSDLLENLESTGEVVPESAMLELASLVINAVASLHAWPGGLAHGALNASHVFITNDGRVMLTDCVFGAGLEVLQRNRENLWKEFRLAMPPSASLARFDQQADVTQMGVIILAIVLQRPMHAHEYPRGVSDLIMTATQSAAGPGSAEYSSSLRTWLQEAMQVHPRLAFRSAVESQRSFADINSRPAARRAGAMALQVLVRTTCGEGIDHSTIIPNMPMAQPSDSIPGTPQPPAHADPPHGTLDSILRSVFPKH
jgi:hypothetical protein